MGRINEVVKRVNRGPPQITRRVQHKAPHAHACLKEENCQAEVDVLARHSHKQRNSQEFDRDCARRYRHPLQGIEEPISGMIGEARNKVSNEAAQRQQQDPIAPIRAIPGPPLPRNWRKVTLRSKSCTVKSGAMLPIREGREPL